MSWTDLTTLFFLGLFAGSHCAWMCAPFALAVSRGGAPGYAPLLLRHLAYQAGKTLSYFTLGVLLLTLGLWLGDLEFLAPIRAALSWLLGVLIVWLGLGLLRPGFGAFLTRLVSRLAARGGSGGSACAVAGALFRVRSPVGCLLLGWVNGLVPCAMSFGALLFMVSRGTVEAVAFGSLAFGAGTFPVLLLVGGAGARATAWIRRFPWAAGVGCIAAGLLVALRPHFGHIAYWCGF